LSGHTLDQNVSASSVLVSRVVTLFTVNGAGQ
jgi:hypothetical protein